MVQRHPAATMWIAGLPLDPFPATSYVFLGCFRSTDEFLRFHLQDLNCLGFDYQTSQKLIRKDDAPR